MRFFKHFFAIAILTTCLLTGCSSISVPANANTSFRNFTLNLFQSEVSSTTIGLHYSLQNPERYGITSEPITFGSFYHSQIASHAYLENLRASLESFDYTALSRENQLTYDILDFYLESAELGNAYYLYEEPLSPLTGIHTQLPILLAEYEFHDTNDIETYLSLLKTLPEYFESLIRFEKEKSASGLFMSDDVADEIIAQCNAFVEMGESNYLISTFEDKARDLNVDSYISQNREIVKNTILPCYEKLASSITSLKGTGRNAQGLCHYSEGRDYYEYLVKRVTGSERTIHELQNLIKTQITSDTSTLQQVLTDNPSIFREQLSLSQTPEELLDSLQHKISTTFPEPAKVNVEVKKVHDSLAEYLSPAFYLIPAIDSYEQNVIYINDYYDMDDISLFTTLAHEGYPGHLYQTTYYTATNPDPIRTYLNFTGYVEGWATYAEMCSYYISPLEKPLATALQKNSSIILGLYAAADIGIHYDGWDLTDTIEHFCSYGIEDKETIKEIYNLILGDPGNYLSYYIGYAEILELKKEYAGTLMEFHKRLLEIGPAPFKIIKEYL